MTTDVRWLDATQMRAWRGFLDLHARLAAKLNRDLQRTSGLTLSDYDVLVHLTDVPEGRLRAFELGDGLQWDKSRVSKQVARLAARGLVAKEECEADRRGAYVVLTPAGREAIEAAAPAHVELVHRLVFDTITPEQVREWAAISRAILQRIEAG
ncbi:MarR family winged helix-turn-helix transcriptional regulator [Paractinoplanes globisporus]|uniref:MarR family winged helix-turn-helix transcriptional regulator n=1 Tax=Paractinoplanes globisporus TaxID=113565 RepID=A0ABW6WB58_9ACTN|nr:MarR family transcriptional regulator [Actinoplanes globisporus]